VGIIYLVAKVVDAVADPIVGYLTDHTVSRFGRRRPWLLFGAVPFGLAFLFAMGGAAANRVGQVWVLFGGCAASGCGVQLD